ncbi:MAG: hypothetical protein U0359_37625 [Byssovorax sp.]
MITCASLLHASPDLVWSIVSRMPGVNAELWPFLRMGYPREAEGKSLGEAPLGQPLFTSTLWAIGVLPYDRHAIVLTEIDPGRGFVEESTSLTMRRWRHERRLVPVEGGNTRLIDRLTFTPVIPGAEGIVTPIVRALFAHRHRRLRARFGGEPADA